MSETMQEGAESVVSGEALRQLRATVRSMPDGGPITAGPLVGGVAPRRDEGLPGESVAEDAPAALVEALPDPADEAVRPELGGASPLQVVERGAIVADIAPAGFAIPTARGAHASQPLPADAATAFPAAAPPSQAPAAPAAAIAAAPEAPDALATHAVTKVEAADAAGVEDAGVPLVVALRDSGPLTRVSVNGLPPGARLSAGTEDADGQWILAPEDLQGLTLLPATDWSGVARLTVRVTSPDGTGGDPVAITVTVAAVADAPVVRAGAAVGAEDTAIRLDLSAALVDRDGSEALTLAILGVPEGAILSAGTRQPDGSWRVAAADLPALSLTPPRDFAGSIALTLRATATEGANGDAAVVERGFTVTVAPVADGATLGAMAAGREDTAIPLEVAFGPLSDASESWDPTAIIRGVPAGATLSSGTDLGGGAWQVYRAALAAGSLAITPPANSDAPIALTIETRIIDTQGGLAVREVGTALTVAVSAVADAPEARAANVAGEEDRAIALDLSAVLVDRDGSETLALAILGVPEGATLSAGTQQPDGSWRVAAGDLAAMTITPPRDFAGSIALTLRATVTEGANGDAAVVDRAFAVTVGPRAEAEAALVASGSGAEDGWIAIEARFATPDADGSERLGPSVTISGVPDGAVLSGGALVAPGTWSVPTAELLSGSIAIRPLADSDADFQLTLTATQEDTAGALRDTRTLVARAEIAVAAVADAPEARAANVVGEEDRAIALDLSAALSDRDGSETLALAILGVPEGATLSAGSRQADGSWALRPGDLAGVTITPSRDFSGSIALTLRATSTEGSNGDAAVTQRGFAVTVAPLVDGAALTATASGAEDTAIAIHAAFGTSPDASEAWDPTAIIRGVPVGATLSSGTDLGGGAWQVDQAALAAGAVAITPPAHSDAPIALTIDARITDRDGNGASRGVTAGATVAVAAVADAPVALAGAVAGVEDTAIRLDLSAALVDRDRSETLSLAILGVPEGATLSAGTRQTDGSWRVAPADLPTLSLTPPRDFAGDVTLRLRAIATEARGGSAVTEDAFTVHVAARADAARGNAGGEGAEDTWIAIRGVLATTDADGSERLGRTLTIAGVPAGAALSHGSQVSPGTWSVPREAFEAGALAILPPASADADIALRITVETHDGDNTATTEIGATIVVRAVADAPTVQVADLEGREDTPIRFMGLGGALTDADGSETLGFVLSGVPATATLSAGSKNTDGTWSLTPAQLAAASITPAAHFSGSMDLTLTAVATEARDGAAPARTSAAFRIGVDPLADAGTISGSVTGNEDTAILVKPGFATPDGDGSESWSATSRVSGVPAGATLSRGVEISAGIWDVSTADLRAGLVSVRPPANSDADFTLTIRATLTDAGNGTTDSREISGTHRVTVRAVADAPVVTVADAAGAEDGRIALSLGARLTDLDGSERLSLVLAGVPAGATLSAGTRNADGTWTVAPAELAGLAITPPRDFSGTMNLTLRATASDNDSKTAVTSASFAVRVEGVADVAGLRVGPAMGAEDSGIALRVSGWATDADGSERLAGFRLLDVPEGAVVRAGGVVLARQPDGSILVEAAVAPTLNVTPPANSDRDFTLRVTAISAEPNGSTAESPARDLPVRVDAVADAPVWLRVGTTGAEDMPIALDLAARLPDADGSERLSYVVSGLPAGAVLSAGRYRGPGSWSLTAEEAAGATILPPRDFAGTINLTVAAVAQEADGGHQAVSTVSFPLRVTAVVDTGAWSATARGAEDSPIALNLAPGLRDGDGSERLVGTVMVEGIPDGAVLRLADGGVVQPGEDGAWRIAAERLRGVTLTMPADSDLAVRLAVTVTVEDIGGVRSTIRGSVTVDPAGVADMPRLEVSGIGMRGHASDRGDDGWAALPIALTLTDTDGSEAAHLWVRDVPRGFTLSAGTPAGDGAWLLRAKDLDGLRIRPPAGFGGEVKLRVQGVSVEREGDTARDETSIVLKVEPPREGSGGDGGGCDPGHGGHAAQPPVLAASAEDGREDGAVALGIRAETRDSDKGEEVLGLGIEGLPRGARLSAGIHDPERDVWVLRPGELEGLQVIPPADFAGEIALRITAVAVERTGDVATTTDALAIRFEAVADGAAISAAPAAGAEDRAVPLNLGIAARDADGSEAVVAITLSGLPRGATIAPGAGIRDNGDGSWSVEPAAVGTVRLLPPENAHGTFALTVTATTRETSNGATATTSRGVSVVVAALADAPMAAAADVAGREDTPIALGLSASLVDRDGSEALSVVVSGLPEGARLSAGVNNGDGSWTLTPAQLPGLAVTPPKDWSGSMALTMQAHAMERSTGEVATTRLEFRATVAGAADAPLVDAAATAAGREDAQVALDIVARLTDTDGSESLLLVVTGVPAGAAFSAGTPNPDGSWTIPGAALPGLAFTPPPNYAGTLRLDFAAVAAEADGDRAATAFQVAVTVDPIADAPVLSLAGLSGLEDTAIGLPLAATLTDTDGSESIARFVVAGLPVGAKLSAGTKGSDGAWTLTAAQAATVSLTPPAHFSGTLSLSVTAVSREVANGAEASTTATLSVTIAPVADAPVLTAVNASGAEDQSIPLSLSAALADTDGSESFTAISVAGLPAGFALSAGTPLGGGAWSLQRADLAGLRLAAPPDWNGTVNLTLQAVAADGGGTAAATRAFSVTVAAVNDAPVLSLSLAPNAAIGQERAAATGDATIADGDSARMGGATVTLSGGGAGDRLVFSGFALHGSGIEVATAPDGSVTLTGAASAATYERVLQSLAIENDDGLAAGTRSIGLSLRDEAGAAAATQIVALSVLPSHIAGGAADAELRGTAGHDTFTGGAGDETMTGGAGADLFIVAMGGGAMGGGNDGIDGGTGAWTDTIRIDGAGAPNGGNWIVVVEAGTTMIHTGDAFDFAQPASGHVQFADGSQVEFQGIERITW